MEKQISNQQRLLDQKQRNLKWAGWTLAGVSLLGLLAMLHHPTIGSHETREQVIEVMHEAGINTLVHSTMILVVMFTLASLTLYSRARGFAKFTVVIALLAYAIGSASMIGAALINGFIFPEIVSGFVGASDERLADIPVIRALCWNANQVLANMGVFAMSLAIFSWSMDLWGEKLERRVISLFGLLVVIGASGSLMAGWVELDVPGMTRILLAQGVWYLLLAYRMIFRMKADDNS